MLRVRGKGFVCGCVYCPFAFCFCLVLPCQGKTHVTGSHSFAITRDCKVQNVGPAVNERGIRVLLCNFSLHPIPT